MRAMIDVEIENRVAKIRGWLDHLEAMYDDLLSRPSETASLSGFDSDPRRVPCEHRLAWMRERLCLACDNSGWRPATKWERDEGLAIDPYATDVSSGFTVVRHESDSARRARDSRRMDAVISGLRRDERIRANLDAPETRESRWLARVGHKGRMLNKILVALEAIRDRYPEVYMNANEEETLRLIAQIIPGKIDNPPGL